MNGYKPFTVKYHIISSMLLNEMEKQALVLDQQALELKAQALENAEQREELTRLRAIEARLDALEMRAAQATSAEASPLAGSCACIPVGLK